MLIFFFLQKKQHNLLCYEHLASLRGTIRDRFGNILVTNTPVTHILLARLRQQNTFTTTRIHFETISDLFMLDYSALKRCYCTS